MKIEEKLNHKPSSHGNQAKKNNLLCQIIIIKEYVQIF